MSAALLLANLLQALPAWISTLPTWVGTLPTWLGAVCAVYGLTTWQYQLHYKEKYELARRLLRAAYKYRDAINQARYPIAYAHPGDDDENSYRKLEQECWSQRFEKINAAKRELKAEQLEAEVVVGSNFEDILQDLFNCDTELYTCVLEHLDSIGDSCLDPKANQARASRRKAMFAKLNYHDEFSLRVLCALEAFEQELRPILGRKRPGRALRRARP